jgi:teichuronic acid exporter
MEIGIHKAFWWSTVERFGQQGIQLALALVLARLLTPADYGLIGMLAVFFAFASAVGDAGFGAALIQRKHIGPDDEASVLFLNVATGAALTLVLCACSPAVSLFFRQPALTLVLCILSFQLLFNSFGLVQVALLTRQLDFRTQAIASIASAAISGVLGICVAWAGGGIWSLVTQTVSRSLFRSILLWSLATWRPRGAFSWHAIGSLWAFSSPLLAAGLMDTIFSNIYGAILGRLSTVQVVGNYTTANQLQLAPSTTAGGILGSVLLPHFASRQDSPDFLRDQLRKTMRIAAALVFPLMLAIGAMAHGLVISFLTEKWAGCVPMLRILAIVGLIYPLHVLHLSLLKGIGRTDLFLRLEIVKKIVVVLLIAAAWKAGAMAIIASILVSSIIAYIINSYWTRRLIGYSWFEQCQDVAPALLVSVLALAPALYIDLLVTSRVRLWLLAEVGLTTVIGSTVGWLLRGRIYPEIATIIGMMATGGNKRASVQ